jgi:hypothetical protein
MRYLTTSDVGVAKQSVMPHQPRVRMQPAMPPRTLRTFAISSSLAESLSSQRVVGLRSLPYEHPDATSSTGGMAPLIIIASSTATRRQPQSGFSSVGFIASHVSHLDVATVRSVRGGRAPHVRAQSPAPPLQLCGVARYLATRTAATSPRATPHRLSHARAAEPQSGRSPRRALGQALRPRLLRPAGERPRSR